MKNGKNGKKLSDSVVVGNTDTTTTELERKQLIKYCFTYNNYNMDELESIYSSLKNVCEYFLYGEEVGESGTPHLQGFIYLKKSMRITELKKLSDIIYKFNFSEMRKDVINSVIYCSKDGVIYHYNLPEEYLNEIEARKEIKKHKLPWWDNYNKKIELIEPTYNYQKFILDIIQNKPNKRDIYWFYDSVGNVGKTSLSKYMSYHYKAINIDGNKKDILYAAAEAKSYIYLIDLPRSSKNHVSYNGIEAIKNGYYFSGKYESKMIVRNHPHIFIFSNYLPEINNLSVDRWQIYEIYKNDLDYDCVLLDINNLNSISDDKNYIDCFLD